MAKQTKDDVATVVAKTVRVVTVALVRIIAGLVKNPRKRGAGMEYRLTESTAMREYAMLRAMEPDLPDLEDVPDHDPADVIRAAMTYGLHKSVLLGKTKTCSRGPTLARVHNGQSYVTSQPLLDACGVVGASGRSASSCAVGADDVPADVLKALGA